MRKYADDSHPPEFFTYFRSDCYYSSVPFNPLTLVWAAQWGIKLQWHSVLLVHTPTEFLSPSVIDQCDSDIISQGCVESSCWKIFHNTSALCPGNQATLWKKYFKSLVQMTSCTLSHVWLYLVTPRVLYKGSTALSVHSQWACSTRETLFLKSGSLASIKTGLCFFFQVYTYTVYTYINI